jgi:hypothetical protein
MSRQVKPKYSAAALVEIDKQLRRLAAEIGISLPKRQVSTPRRKQQVERETNRGAAMREGQE